MLILMIMDWCWKGPLLEPLSFCYGYGTFRCLYESGKLLNMVGASTEFSIRRKRIWEI